MPRDINVQINRPNGTPESYEILTSSLTIPANDNQPIHVNILDVPGSRVEFSNRGRIAPVTQGAIPPAQPDFHTGGRKKLVIQWHNQRPSKSPRQDFKITIALDEGGTNIPPVEHHSTGEVSIYAHEAVIRNDGIP